MPPICTSTWYEAPFPNNCPSQFSPLVAGQAPSANEQALDQDMASFIEQAYAPSTRSAYATHRHSYLAFCQVMGYSPVPASSSTLCRYAAVLPHTMKYHSMKQYLNIVRILHSEWGLANLLAGDYYLQCTVRGIRHNHGDAQIHKAPLTPDLLIGLSPKHEQHRKRCFWASLLLMFFAMLRVSCVLCKSTSCDHSWHLTPSDLHFHHEGLDVIVRSTKTIQFQGRCLMYPFQKMSDDTILCPTKAMVLYLALSPPLPPSGPLFVTSSSGYLQPLTATTFAAQLKTILIDLGIPAGAISCHSARRGGACLAYKFQIPIDTIRLIRDWRSNSYMKYIEVESLLEGKALHSMLSNTLQS